MQTENAERITSFDRKACKLLRKKLVDALTLVEAETGLEIKVGAISFTPTNCTAKLEIATIGSNGEARTQEVVDWGIYAPLHGLSSSDRGRRFTVRGETYVVVGWRRHASRYPIVARRERDDKQFKFTVGTVKEMLHGATGGWV